MHSAMQLLANMSTQVQSVGHTRGKETLSLPEELSELSRSSGGQEIQVKDAQLTRGGISTGALQVKSSSKS